MYPSHKGFQMLQCPSVSSLKCFTSANIEKSGKIEDRLLICIEQYHKEETVAKGKKEPLGEGALIVDEVRVSNSNVFACII